ncbi:MULTISPECIES: alpha/beta fold hydrolase [Haloferax]|uniref:Haloalkane dehalogenase n=1 Tax=Haloferax massiliensis TaxID=1476858 RepID=A0A0D6JPC0_9EURY|nr:MULTISPECIES: alpha/beta hydrolase [Haloferax]MDS0241284.1 alpha/beta hydrolase [Haloferax sp. S2CR25]MDS0444405.1 alpha/beta hydrolase [Haloferax sp. S2CR25-2]CQR49709.1 Haloalkane dehalogenase [Haloferax massiliensis]
MATPDASPSDPREAAESAEAKTLALDGGRRLTYAEYGDSDGVPVVFLHGAPGSRLLGALFDAAAEERGIRVLAPDRPGYGRSSSRPTSEEPGDPSQGSAPTPSGDFFDALLDDIGAQSAGLVAFSGGSRDALAVAAARPDGVRHVSVVAGAVPPETREETPRTQRFLSWLATNAPALLSYLFRGQAWLAGVLDPSVVVAQYTADDAETVPDGVAVVVRDDFVAAVSRSRRGVVDDFRTAAAPWDVPLDDIETDVSLWHGDADTNVPIAGVRRLESEISGARLREVRGADHLRTLLRSAPGVLDEQRRAARSLDPVDSAGPSEPTAPAESHHRV